LFVSRLHSEISLPAASTPKSSKFTAAAAPSLAPSPADLFVGTSGWAYPTWKPGFYPATLPARGFLHFYAAHLTSVEVNYTFRSLPAAAQLQGWLDATPPGFRFTFKAPQRITHFQRLRESRTALSEFIAALAPARAAGKLGALLFQLPPNFADDEQRLAAFLEDPAFAANPHLQLAFEFRHPSWFAESTYDILRRHNAALCVAESDDLATPDIATANFRCYRLRRNGGYTPVEIQTFAQRLTPLAHSEEVYVYFKHEEEPTGALNAVAVLATASQIASSTRGESA
jgi:uncharacterized protein YecE (DUF72 family)